MTQDYGPVLLIHPGIYERHNPLAFPPWGILCVGSWLRDLGLDVEVVDLNGTDVLEKVRTLVADLRPRAIGLTAKLGLGARRLREAIEGARLADPQVPIGVGGPLVSTFPDRAHPLWREVDGLFWGDGEASFSQWLLEGCTSGVFAGPAEVDLDIAGVPAWWTGLCDYVWPARHWPNMDVNAIHVAAGRGCTRRCTFCYLNRQAPGRRFRFVSPAKLLADLVTLSELLSVEGFYFVDDCLIDRTHEQVRDFCQRNLDAGSPFQFGCDIQLPDLERVQLLRLMQEAGFRAFYLGIESASAVVRKRLGKGSVSVDLATLLQRAFDMGFVIRASIGIGWPGETVRDIEATLSLIDSVPELMFDAYKYLPLPGAPLSDAVGLKPDQMSPFEDFSEFNTNHTSIPDGMFESLWRQLLRRQNERAQRYWARGDVGHADEAKPVAQHSDFGLQVHQ